MSFRRPLLKLFMIFATAAAAGFVVIAVAIEAGKRSKHASVSVPVGEGPRVCRKIQQEYGVDVAFKDHKYPVSTYHGPIRATNAEAARVDRYGMILADEFSLYPPDFVRRSMLKRIVLCRGLSFNGQYRAAVPDFEHDTLYLDVMAGVHSRDYQRRAIHHDFFHMIDWRDDGELYSDQQWARLNPDTFRYGRGGAKMQDDPGSGEPWDEAGFVTRYATSAVEEDKAELFAHMMTAYARVVQRAASDSTLRRKVAFMKALLRKFSPDMNEAFWEELDRRQSPATRSKRPAPATVDPRTWLLSGDRGGFEVEHLKPARFDQIGPDCQACEPQENVVVAQLG